MKSAQCLLLAAVFAGGFSSAQAATKTITVSCETGTLAHNSGSGGWKYLWTSTETDPQVTINTAVNNIQNATSGPLQIAPGTSKNCNIVISTPTEGWQITGYSFEISGSGSKTITHNGTTTTISTTAQTVTETGLTGTSQTLVYAGDNIVSTFANFTVTLSDVTVLDVDPMPDEDTGCAYKVTNLVEGDYNDFTAWYHIQDGTDFLTGNALTDAGSDGNFEDAYLYCFIKENDGTYAVYNKADGKTALTYADGKVLNGTKVLDVNLAQQFLPVSTEYGEVCRDKTPGSTSTNKWRDSWFSSYTPQVIFEGPKNNMTTTGSGNNFSNTGDFILETGNSSGGDFTWSFRAADNMYVYAYTFLAKKNGTYTTSTTIGGTALGNAYKRISATNNDDLTTTSFVQNGTNGNGAVIADFYVTVRRILTHHNTRTASAIFRVSDYGHERRIPAITTVEAGTHAGRLVAVYDNRIHGGDIGAGNIGLEIAVSDDNGVTWSTPAYGKTADGSDATKWNPDHERSSSLPMATMQEDANTYWDCAFGDAAIVSDRETGRILMMAAAGPMNFFAGRRNSNPNQCARWYSEDGGETWNGPTQMTEHILALFDGEPQFGCIDSQFIGSGRMMQSRYIKVGDYYRVYAVLSSQNGGTNSNTRNWVLYTDDFGQTWKVLGGTDRAAVTSNGDEPKAEELPDGSVLLAARCKTGNRNFNIFRYTDVAAGQGRWDDHVTTNMGFGPINACDGEIMILPVVDNKTGEPCYLALQSFPYGGGRANVTIAYKPLKDAADIATPSAFTTWEGSYRVSLKSSAYSTMTWQKDNTIGFFYEEVQTGSYDGVYINLTVDEITNGAYSYKADTDNVTANKLRDALVDLRSSEYQPSNAGYIGEVLDPEAFNKAVDAYKSNPTADAYVALNVAEYNPETRQIADGGIYHFISAQTVYSGTSNGLNRDEDVYLATDGTHLIATNDATTDSRLFKVTGTDNGNWHLYNEANKVYAPKSPSTSSQFGVSAEPVEYRIASGLDGKSTLSCVNPTTAAHPAIHLDGSSNIVAWSNSGSPASNWYMELVKAPESSEIEEIERIDDADAAETFYDLCGRHVATPTRRGIYVTSRGRKLLVR